ncbi:MAG: hypothetical protein A3J38_01980 [Gammaproteobacteria bacterium RIFCSPHIGHO2_12_FULL_45_9]|nr:MAG: hypothetical protein A3J38_01980 [Gammaproteobacteria bacterium RIFCSPHIGHO2_12_FULL_45_9]
MKDFEGNEEKRGSNIAKHGIDFLDAIRVFDDGYRIECETERQCERRLQTIGMMDGIIIVFVVYVARNHKKRIISARVACKKERDAYYGAR